MNQINKNVLVVTKLIEETKNGVIKWDSMAGGDVVLPGESMVVDLVYTTRYRNKYMRLFKYKTRIPYDPNMRVIVGRVQPDHWQTNVRLEFTDYAFSNSLWTFPEISSISDLYNTVRYNTADVRIFFDQLFNDLVIYEAKYGANDSFIDVAAQLTEKIVDDKVSIIVNNLLGGDPLVGIAKKIIIKYSFKGEFFEKTFAEGQELILP